MEIAEIFMFYMLHSLIYFSIEAGSPFSCLFFVVFKYYPNDLKLVKNVLKCYR